MKELLVVSAGLSEPSTTKKLAERIADSVCTQVSKRGEELDLAFVDIAPLIMDLGTLMSTGIYNVRLRSAIQQVNSADAMVAATPVFSASYSGVFKMFFDALDKDSLTGVPVIIAATAGTSRHSLVLDFALRPLFSYLRAVVMPTGVFAATADFGAAGQDSGLDGRIVRAARELSEHIVGVDGHVEGFGPDFGGNQADSESALGLVANSSALLADVSLTDKHSQRRDSATYVAEDVVDFSRLLAGHDGGNASVK